ncbi:MAG: alpha/beta fold hydrolase [Arenicellales bacterium]|jgi:pimeloyl-ACP methyl ester carboxylesterase
MTDLRIGSMLIEDTGEGSTVVMVHGLGGTSNSFQTLMASVADCRVLRPDLPGAGRSAYRPGLSSLERMAVSIKDCLRAAGLEQAHFVGHSMGTMLCQYLAAGSPELVRSLTLFGPILEPPVAARQALKERAQAARASGMAGIADAICMGSIAEASRRANPAVVAFVRESIMRQDPAGYASHCDALSEAPPADHAAIRCPTLLVAGDKDPVAPVDMGRRLQERIQDARLEVVPGVGHWIMVEAPGRSTELLRGHLDEIARQSHSRG